MVSGDGARGTNRLLDALPADDRERLTRLLQPVFLAAGTVLFEAGEAIVFVEFPLDCVVSLAAPLDSGAIVEVAAVGNEGIVGIPLAIGGSLAVRAMCSVAGWAERMDASAFAVEVDRHGSLEASVGDYLLALFGQVARAAACNRLHSVQARLSRWLLMAHDRVGVDEFAITHALLASLLGSRRATVTLSAETLQAVGLITYRRGRVTIVDRASLEAAACECYEVVERELDGVVQRAWQRSRRGAAGT